MSLKLRVFVAAMVAALALTGNVRAGTLLDLEDPAGQTDTPYTFTFTATGPSTMISFAGYQLPAFEFATKISLKSGGGPNLLGKTWTLTPADMGSLADQFDDGLGTGTNGLSFGAVVEDHFDTFSQSVGTVAGSSYTLSFLYSNDAANAPSGFVVSNDINSVPEPATLTLLGIGLAGVAGYGWRRRQQVQA